MAAHQFRVEPHIAEIPRLIDRIQACCRGDGLSDESASRIMLVIEEAVANTIAHGFGGLPPPHRLAVRLDITAAAVTVEVIDNGWPFDPTAVPGPDLSLPLEQRDPGGFGIHLMRHLMDHIEYRRHDGNNILRLEKARD